MAAAFRLGQLLKGQKGSYTLGKQFQDSVWLAITINNKQVIIKSMRHFQLENKQDVLKQFQDQTSYIQSLLDEIVNPPDSSVIVLRHLADHLLNASTAQKLTIQEVKYNARSIVESLKLLHDKKFVHTDNNLLLNYPDNVLVNYRSGDIHFTDIQLADMGSTISAESAYIKNMHWYMWNAYKLLTLIYGDSFFIFKPNVLFGHEDYELQVLV
ncbi:serine/threonine protein kinase [Coccidioides posadasii str. Silveira]|uniref:Serine/threonine protein kinase n=1 Tax=Coccidioides posadasii (strain RMSCC 757 / Silveira) TaxID=443226 RepID=E9DBP0_COCPS|nr:serine/threonine protein kinase [Coccidioides posadasii str. Silveira]